MTRARGSPPNGAAQNASIDALARSGSVRASDMTPRRDVQRNTAFFLGAFGTALGVLGGVLSGLGIVAWLWPEFANTAPDWFFMPVVVGMMVLSVVAWPALDWLVNHRPVIGGPVVAISGLLVIAIGAVAVLWTAWGLTGWLAMAGGLLVLPAAYLALVGGGTEPLTWRSLHDRSHPARVDPGEVRRVPRDRRYRARR